MSSLPDSTSPKYAKKNLVTPLLEQLFPTPVSFFSQSHATSNDVVPLCLHCLMVEAGCTPLSSKNNRPPSAWNKHPDEWIVEYGHGVVVNGELASTTFRLHCSLQQRSGRLFVHAEEIGEVAETANMREPEQDAAARNIQVLGLQLSNYTKVVSDEDDGSLWSSYVRNERTLKEMFRQFIVKPLLETSGRRALEGLRERGGGKELYQEAMSEATTEQPGEENIQEDTSAAKGADTPSMMDSSRVDKAEPPTTRDENGLGETGEKPRADNSDPDLFSPDPGYTYSTYSSYIESYGGSLYVGLAAVIGVACVFGWWTLRTRKHA